MRPSRVLLMYITEHSGHHRAAMAVAKGIRQLDPDVELVNLNAFNYTNPILEKLVNKAYLQCLQTTPELWDYLYDNPKIIKNTARLRAMIHKINAPKLEFLFDGFPAQTIVCTQAYPCGMVADYKQANGVRPFQVIAVVTDFSPHAYWLAETVDAYVVHSEEGAQRLRELGVPAGKIWPLGIPIDPRFAKRLDRSTARSRLGLDAQRPVILVMGGGGGFGPIFEMVEALQAMPIEAQLAVMTGTNEALYRRLMDSSAWRLPARFLQVVPNINEWMAAADVLITKPGGLTAAEALASALPMVLVHPIPGQEARNAELLKAWGAAIQVEELARLSDEVARLVAQPDRLAQMRQRALAHAKPNAAADVAQLVVQG